MRSAPGADVRETHISCVFFSDDRAYKLLKRVQMPFLDLADRTVRLDAARREFDLNCRLAPDVYLGLADVHEGDQLVDHLLVMRRLPADRRLATLVAAGEADDCIRNVARTIASFHSTQPAILEAPSATPERLAANWADNFGVLRDCTDDVIPTAEQDRVEALATRYLAGRAPLLRRRIADGLVRDGHGDLLADDIFCLDDGPRIIDCLAFNDDYRIGDVLLDVAFLAMDLELIGGVAPASAFLDWYREFTDEHHPASLAHHFVAYRSHVRAKVACLRHAQGHTPSAATARAHHQLAARHLERGRIRMVLVGGGPGVGKTVTARGLGDHYACPVLSSDEIRRQRFGIPQDEHRFEPPGEGLYAPARTDAVYEEQLAQAELLVAHGESVILDASWNADRHREAARLAAERHHVDLVEIECVLDPTLAKERIARRLSNPDNPSDATPEVVDHLARSRAPWPTAHRVDTASPPAAVLRAAIDRVDESVDAADG